MNYRRLNMLGFGCLLVLFPAIALRLVPWWFLAALALAYLLVLGWGVFDIGSQFFMKTYWKGPLGKVVLTFDDGPHPVHTPRILDILREEGVQATFFCIGECAEKYPLLIRQMVESGHTIGNHSYSHAYVFSRAASENQLLKGRDALESITGKTTIYYRPPFGVMTPKIAWAAKRYGCQVIGWDLRSRDGTFRSKERILSRVSRLLKRSSILLFHDTNPLTPELLREVIHLCRKNGMKIVPLPEIIGIVPYRE